VIKTYIVVALVSYLLGSIPFGYILVKLFLKQDIRATGSGNIGATNVARSGAKGLAIATLILDALKGLLAVIISPLFFFGSLKGWAQIYVDNQRIDPNGPPWPPEVLLAMFVGGVFAILGHMFPVWLGFKGGKGVATAVGVFLALAPAALGIAFVCFAIVVILTRYVSLGSIVSAIVFPFLAYSLEPETRRPLLIAILTFCSLIIVLKHHENIRRLIAGTENKFGGKKSVPPPDAMEKQA